MPLKYRIKLSEEERIELDGIVDSKKIISAKKVLKARERGQVIHLDVLRNPRRGRVGVSILGRLTWCNSLKMESARGRD